MSDPTPPTPDGAPQPVAGFAPPYAPAPSSDAHAFAGPPAPGYGAPPPGPAAYAYPPAGYAPDPYHAAGYPLAFAVAPAPTRPSRELATVSISLAGVGLLLAFVPILTWFAGILLVAAAVLAIVALARAQHGGAGLAVGGLTVSLLGLIVSVTMTFPSIAMLSAAFDELSRPFDSAAVGADAEPGVGIPREDLVIIETAVSPDPNDSRIWRYTVILENPNHDHIFEWAEIEVEAVDAAGTVLTTSTSELMILQGRTAISGYLSGIDDGVVDHIDVVTPAADTAAWSPQRNTGSMTIEGLTASADAYSTSVTGTVRGDFYEENRYVLVVVVARAPDGEILLSEYTHIDRLPPNDERASFEVDFLDVLPDDTTYEAYAAL